MILRLVLSILLKLFILVIVFIAYSVRLVIFRTHSLILQLSILMQDIIYAGSAPFERLIKTCGSDFASQVSLLEGDRCACLFRIVSLGGPVCSSHYARAAYVCLCPLPCKDLPTDNSSLIMSRLGETWEVTR